jgi:hypothetical protein
MRGNRRLLIRGMLSVIAASIALASLVGTATAWASSSPTTGTSTKTSSCQPPKPAKKKSKKAKKKSKTSASTTSTAGTSATVPPANTPLPPPEPASGAVTPTTFTPTFTITFPATGWTKYEGGPVNVDFGLNGGSEESFGSTDVAFFNVSPSTPAQALSELSGSASYTETKPTATCVGNVTAQTFDVTPTTGAAPLFEDQGYPPGTKARIWIANVHGKAVVVAAEAADAAFDNFAAQLDPILQTVRFN